MATQDETPSYTTASGATYPASLLAYALPLPTVLSTHPNITSCAVGGFIFHPVRGLLLIRRAIGEAAFPGYWEVPGGGVEAPPTDATLLDAVVREVWEETGLKVTRLLRCFGCVEFQGRSGRWWRKWNFEVEAEEGEVKLEEREHDGVLWVRGWEDVVREECLVSSGMESAVREALGIWKEEQLERSN